MKKIECILYVGGVPLDELSPQDRDAWETRVVEIYEEIVLQEVEKMQKAGKSKAEIMKYLCLN
jgi:hypothetical protein